MFTRYSIKHLIQELDLKDTYVVLMGGSLAMRGIRPTHDIDLWVSEYDFKKLMKSYGIDPEDVTMTKLGQRKFVINSDLGEIEVFEHDDIKSEDPELIDGIYCQRMENILSLKKYFNREKDQKDILMIEEILEKEKV